MEPVCPCGSFAKIDGRCVECKKTGREYELESQLSKKQEIIDAQSQSLTDLKNDADILSEQVERLKIKNNKLKKYLLIEVGISDEELIKLQEGIGVT